METINLSEEETGILEGGGAAAVHLLERVRADAKTRLGAHRDELGFLVKLLNFRGELIETYQDPYRVAY